MDQFSLTTTPIEQFFNETSLGTATGFVWSVGNRYFLVTNWHVVTLRAFPGREYLKSHGGRPNTLRVWFNFGAHVFEKQQYDIKIRDADDRPLWLAHPFRACDIAVVPLEFTEDQLKVINLRPMNELTTDHLAPYIGMDVFILGYPFGITAPNYPIWKRGSIASEPDLVMQTTQYLLVDTASRPGMSGAPVILRSWSNHVLADGTNRPLDSTTRTTFVGVYSGRLHTKSALEAQIGMVWPKQFIHDIIACNKRDED